MRTSTPACPLVRWSEILLSTRTCFLLTKKSSVLLNSGLLPRTSVMFQDVRVAFNQDTFVLTLQIRESSAKTSKRANFPCGSRCLASIWLKTLFNFSKPGLMDRKDSARNHRTNDKVKFNARLTRARHFYEDSPLRQPTQSKAALMFVVFSLKMYMETSENNHNFARFSKQR